MLARGADTLAGNGEPRADAQILLAHAIGRSREWIVAHGEAVLPSSHVDRYVEMCEQRAHGKPVPYITGLAGFYHRDFVVDERVLIPRPETEHLVEDAIACLWEAPSIEPLSVFEAGVGSGAIACTIAAEVEAAIVEGTDVSSDAIEVANLNARRLNVDARCTFHVADVAREQDGKAYDLVIANLPYVPSADVPRKPDPVGFEPRAALDGGPDGLAHYRKLLAAAPALLRPGGLLLMEAAPPTIQALRALTESVFPGTGVEVRRDYAGLERYLYVKK